MSKPKVMVNASDVGKAAYCPHALSLQSRSNAKPGEAAIRGTQAHDDLNHYLLNGGDKRCFVATYALGEQHPTTHALRVWRDRALKPYVCGRLLVATYYWVSPIDQPGRIKTVVQASGRKAGTGLCKARGDACVSS